MSKYQLFSRLTVALACSMLACTAFAAPPDGNGNGNGGGGKPAYLKTVKKKDWDEAHVRRILRAFTYGGQATDTQILDWADMSAAAAVAEILTFDFNNVKLSPPEDLSADYCGSLAELQDFWSSEGTDNPMTYPERYRYATLNSNLDLNTRYLQSTWTKMISTRGCNPFLHKMALFLTNYHASIHVRNTRAALIRAYYDDYVAALAEGKNFIEVMTVGAKHAAVSRAYNHKDNKVKSGVFYGNEDFAREYLQLFFGVLGTTEDPDYYETISIKNNALVLTGMDLDKHLNAYGADSSGDWYVSPLVFTDHYDEEGRYKGNEEYHYENVMGAASCLDVLHVDICGATADVKLDALGQVAGNHPESMANVPVKLIGFFADDNLDEDKIDALRGSWEDAEFNLLAFMQQYAISTAFHSESTFKYFTAFERNLIAQNTTILSNEENFGKTFYWSPYNRMSAQGVRVFEPVRNVFGHQTGVDALNNPYIFKDAYRQNSASYSYHVASVGTYTLEDGGTPIDWAKDWGAVIPVDGNGDHVVTEVATWLWNHLIGDDGKNFDVIARAQVESLLASGRDFGYEVDADNRDPDPFYSSADINGGHADAAQTFSDHAILLMDLSTKADNERVGMAVNFITVTPYAFAMEGK